MPSSPAAASDFFNSLLNRVHTAPGSLAGTLLITIDLSERDFDCNLVVIYVAILIVQQHRRDRLMDWDQLLSPRRVEEPASTQPERSEFQRDFDRIVFSAAFRHLQDKTQVHPFPDSDYVRRRLTHSLEVSCVGRSLGTAAGHHLCEHSCQTSPYLPFTTGQIIANACLAHDIGNPPFGHAGERAMGSWFKERLPEALASDLTAAQRADLDRFEGNAQGFRLLTRLQEARNAGGLRLTYATLAAFTKYPTAAENAAR